MPSWALSKFEGAMMKDVNRILETHSNLLPGGRGRKGLGHLTRAGVLLLCAAWELYIEELLVEAAKACRDRANSPDNLPVSVQKTISTYVKESKHQLKPLALAGDGWKTIYLDIVNETAAALNTPKHHTIDVLFHHMIGIEDLSTCWSNGTASVDGFVTARGAVAHRGADSGYIKQHRLQWEFKAQIEKAAVETDNAVRASDALAHATLIRLVREGAWSASLAEDMEEAR